MIYIIDFGSSKVPEIAREIRELEYKATICKWNDNIDLTNVKGVVLSGAPILLTKTDPAIYLEKFSFLKTTTIPILGICFGHQLVGMLFGAKVYLGEENREQKEISLINESILFNELDNPCIFKEDHTEGIELPENFICLAQSDDYPVEAMEHESKKIYGVQFHPEVSGENGKRLLKNFLNNI